MLGEQYRTLSSSLCSFLRSPVTSSHLDPNILLNILFSSGELFTVHVNTFWCARGKKCENYVENVGSHRTYCCDWASRRLVLCARDSALGLTTDCGRKGLFVDSFKSEAQITGTYKQPVHILQRREKKIFVKGKKQMLFKSPLNSSLDNICLSQNYVVASR